MLIKYNMIKLKPIMARQKYEDSVKDKIYKYLYQTIFAPIFNILVTRPVKENASTTTLISYLRNGRLTFEAGKYFRGALNAIVSRQLRELGAKYSKAQKGFELDFNELPTDVKIAIAEGQERLKEKHEKIENFLKAVEGRELPTLGIELEFGKTIEDLNKQFDVTTRKVMPKDLQVSMPLYMQERMKEAYALNLDKYIKEFHDEEILRLRSIVMKNTLTGYRSENLIQAIQYEKKVSYNKAKFLARQETSLLVSKYREERYAENGINWYQWSTSHDQRVRQAHKHLDNKYFRFDQPPITDLATGSRNNPGEDFNCRCQAIPVINEQLEAKLERANR